MTEWRRLWDRDFPHFLVNAGGMGSNFLFYVKFGFYGWSHLIAVLLLWYAVLPLDDWLEKERPFPLPAALITAVVAWFYPLMALSVVAGNALTNIRALLKNNSFWLERVEGLGNVLVYVVPFVLPLRPTPPHLYLAAALYVLFADSFHKIGHRETQRPRAMWLTGLTCLLPLAIIFFTPSLLVPVCIAVLLASLVPFALVQNKKHSWVYTQAWFGLAGVIAYCYYFFVFLP